MTSPSRLKIVPGNWLTDGLILTGANLVAAASNYLFQALMRRHLSWSEFGYLNSTLSLIIFVAVPLTAASLTLTHLLAQIRSGEEPGKIAEVQAASLKLLRRMTWIIFALSLLLLYPVCEFLRFPRLSLVGFALLWIPINLWSTLGGAWCTGLSRFRLLAFLLILSAAVRLIAGGIATSYYPWAEAGVFGTILSGVGMAALAIFSPHHATAASLRQTLLHRGVFVYGAAALAVTFSSFVFLHGDQIVAQRYFPGDELGRYSGAGLLGRAIVWASLPVLTIYFTRRSDHDHAEQSPTPLLWIYLAMIGTGAIAVMLLRALLLNLFLGTHDPSLDDMTLRFALNMIPIGILHGLGCYCLAARKIPECLAFGVCGVAYILALLVFGRSPSLMLAWMGGGTSLALILLGGFNLARLTTSRSTS